MRTNIKTGCLSLAMLLSFTYGTMSQVNVTKVSSEPVMTDKEGVFYNLPRTVIKVDLVVSKIDKLKGPYAAFAQEMLGFENVINASSTEYELSEIHLSLMQEPNPDEYYFIEFLTPKNSKEKQPLNLFFSPSGTLQGFSNPTGQTKKSKSNIKIAGNDSEARFAEIANPGQVEKVDTVVKKIQLDTTVVEQILLNKVTVAKSVEQKAREFADHILKLDQSIENLVSGYQEINYEKGTMQLMLNRMENQRKSYVELFEGITHKSKLIYSFTIVPSKQDADKPVVLCKFSGSKGITDKELAGGETVQIQVTPLGTTKNLQNTIDQRSRQSEKSKGIIYQIPEEAIAVVKVGNVDRAESKFMINQLGVVTFLPGNFSGRLQFYPETGGVEEMISE
jgi:hypothetical protein